MNKSDIDRYKNDKETHLSGEPGHFPVARRSFVGLQSQLDQW